ncbi:FeoA family protein [Treponema pectinovorum]|uniref:FeoA family protein n=1 Tax=Treponema pectinovorum TaxID=164 RepID=UPI0011C8C022|nr:FeoA family protein [Treponema pectinovorum]
MVPLIFAQVGEINCIKKVGGSPEVKKHLESLGFVPGSSVSIVSSIGGNVIVNVKDSRIAISQEMGRKIFI